MLSNQFESKMSLFVGVVMLKTMYALQPNSRDRVDTVDLQLPNSAVVQGITLKNSVVLIHILIKRGIVLFLTA